MTSIATSIITHELSIDHLVKPITQRKRAMSEEKRLVIQIEVGKLVDTNFGKKIKFQTWVANLVLVKKLNNK